MNDRQYIVGLVTIASLGAIIAMLGTVIKSLDAIVELLKAAQ